MCWNMVLLFLSVFFTAAGGTLLHSSVGISVEINLWLWYGDFIFTLVLCVFCIVYCGIHLQGFPDQNRNMFIILTVASNSLFDFSIKLTTLSDAPLCRILRFPQSGELSREKPAAVSCKSLFTFQNDQAPRHSVHGYARNTHTVEKCSVLVNYTLVRCFCVTPTFWTWFQIIVANTRLKAGGAAIFSQ